MVAAIAIGTTATAAAAGTVAASSPAPVAADDPLRLSRGEIDPAPSGGLDRGDVRDVAVRRIAQQARQAAADAREEAAREQAAQAAREEAAARKEAARRQAAEAAREQAEREQAARRARQLRDDQARLAELGWYTGQVDGVAGPGTRAAVVGFQRANGLSADGVVGPATRTRLHADGAVTRAAWEKANPPAPQPATVSSSSSSSRVGQARAIADQLPFDWRAHGVSFKVGCHPETGCHWGVYDYRVRQIWLSPDAFASSSRLRYVVAHEMAHAWQWTTDLDARDRDMAAWGKTGSASIEAGADCMVQVWGMSGSHYWSCPADARAHMADVWAANR